MMESIEIELLLLQSDFHVPPSFIFIRQTWPVGKSMNNGGANSNVNR
jgi:hypothetical protein